MSVGDVPLVPINRGWQCPVCNRGIAPGQMTCDHGVEPTSTPPSRRIPSQPWKLPVPTVPAPFVPYNPFTAPNTFCEACKNGGVCMCVRPNQITCATGAST